MHTARWVLLLLTAFPMLICAQTSPEANLMPMPSSIRFGAGRMPIDYTFAVAVSDPAADHRTFRAVERMKETLSRQTGIPFGTAAAGNAKPVLTVRSAAASAAVQELGEDESYRLTVTPNGAELVAPNTLGVLRGLQTFLQLVELGSEGFGVPAVTIEDHPRFQWRGLMIDSSRHFQPVDVIKRNLDAMEAVKLNVLHWHLSDDQGFRVESRKFPKLQEVASEGEYYTQAEIREIIEYARDRGIRVVPEFDMPGHTSAWLAAYPELGSASGPYHVEHLYGIFDNAIDPTKEEVYKYLDRFIAEMAGLFPDAYFHIGGDEVNGKQWDASPRIREFKKKHGLADNHALQAYFNKRVQALVSKHRKKMMGWDEILQPELPKDTVVQVWRGGEDLATAAKQGYRSILSYGYYLDLSQPARFHYSNDPSLLAGPLTPDQKKLILGGEACMWSELAPPTVIDSRIWPRMAAIAERFWSPESTTDIASMYRRMDAESFRLEWLPSRLYHRGHYLPGLQRLGGAELEESVQVLAEVVEPVKQYQRQTQHKKVFGRYYSAADAFNRLVDVVPPDSLLKVHFEELVDRFLAGKASIRDHEELHSLLSSWAANDAKLQPVIARSALLKEVAPLSAALTLAGNSGLQALQYLESGARPSAQWVDQQVAALSDIEKPQGELFLPVIPSIRRLVEALRSQPSS